MGSTWLALRADLRKARWRAMAGLAHAAGRAPAGGAPIASGGAGTGGLLHPGGWARAAPVGAGNGARTRCWTVALRPRSRW